TPRTTRRHSMTNPPADDPAGDRVRGHFETVHHPPTMDRWRRPSPVPIRRRFASSAFVAVTMATASLLVIAAFAIRAHHPAPAGNAPAASATQSGALADWSEHTTSGPAPRDFAAMAVDATGSWILFGGLSGITALGDTWRWDGSAWTHLHPAQSPSARFGATLTADPVSGRLILFGGNVDGVASSETWSWDGSTWSRLSPAVSPPGRYDGAAAVDPVTHRVLLFGGGGNAKRNDTWIWTGSTWSSVALGHPAPSPRVGAALAADPVSGRLLLQAGYDGKNRLSDTWTWNGTGWEQ